MSCTFTYHFVEPQLEYVESFRTVFPEAACRSDVYIHLCKFENFTFPKCDLVIASHVVLHRWREDASVGRLVAALRPGGTALVIVGHPESAELQMMRYFSDWVGAYPEIKSTLRRLAIIYEEIVLNSFVSISNDDRDTTDGADLLSWYFAEECVAPRLQAAFWERLTAYSSGGVLNKKEACFWITNSCLGERVAP